jgi:hypothetical protein
MTNLATPCPRGFFTSDAATGAAAVGITRESNEFPNERCGRPVLEPQADSAHISNATAEQLAQGDEAITEKGGRIKHVLHGNDFHPRIESRCAHASGTDRYP